jgi:hypothetical protein
MPTNSRSTSRRTTAPKPKVSLDLDKLERDGAPPPPFTFRHGDQEFTLGDPAEIGFQDIVELGNAGATGNALMLARLLGDQYDELIKAGPLPQWKCEPLIDAWMEHYDVDPGKSRGSSTSSNGTASR